MIKLQRSKYCFLATTRCSNSWRLFPTIFQFLLVTTRPYVCI